MRDDATLVELAVAGDQSAFAELYERYFDRVFDFLARMVRDQAEAADLAQDSFLRAMNSLGSLSKGGSFKSWIFTIARNTALNRLERSSRLQPLKGRSDDDDEHGFDVVDADRFGDPEQAAEASSLAALVWEAARGLDASQYAVLDLTVRQGLDSAEVADVLGVTKNNAYVMVNRMKKGLEDAVGALMLFKSGRGACPALDTSLASLQLGEMSPEARRLIDRHAARCDVCGERKRKMTSPFAIFGGFAMVGPPVGIKGSILEGLLQSYPYAAPTGPEASEAGEGETGSGSEQDAAGEEGPSAQGDGSTTAEAGGGMREAGNDASEASYSADGASPAADADMGSTAGADEAEPPPAAPASDSGESRTGGWRKLAAGAAAVLVLGLSTYLFAGGKGGGEDELPVVLAAGSTASATAQASASAEASATAAAGETPAAPPADAPPAESPLPFGDGSTPAPGATPQATIPAAPGPAQPGLQPPPAPSATPDAGAPPQSQQPDLLPPAPPQPSPEDPPLPPPPCMPALQSSVGQLEFGPGVSSLSFGLSGATCGEPVVFSASSPEAWAEAVPASGQVPAGGAATITVRIDRRPIPSGGSTSLQISGGGTSLSVAIRVYPNLVVLPTAMPTRTFLTLRPTATPTSCLTPSACPP